MYIKSYAEIFKPHNFIVSCVCVCSSLVCVHSQFHWDQVFVPWHYVSGSTHMPLLPWLMYPDQDPLWLFMLHIPLHITKPTEMYKYE